MQNSNQSKGRGQRVSFADDTSRSQLGEGDRARDAVEGTSIKPVFSTPFSSFEVVFVFIISLGCLLLVIQIVYLCG